MQTTDTETRFDRTITLADGRQTGFAEAGDPAGRPVIYCHGFPASRLESRLVAAAALRCGVRIIAPDRPGYGLSHGKADRTIAGWAGDVAELAGHLQLHKFSVLGVSGGGPYALALAQGLAGRVESVAVVCGLGPVSRPDVLQSMHWPARFGFGSAGTRPWLTELVYGRLLGGLMRRRPEVALAMLTVGMAEADRRTLVRPEIRSMVCASLREGLRQGPRGPLLEMALYAGEWGFDLAAIDAPMALWHGDADATVPVSHTHLLGASMPQATVRILPGEGHFSLPVDHADEILTALVQAIRKPSYRNNGP